MLLLIENLESRTILSAKKEFSLLEFIYLIQKEKYKEVRAFIDALLKIRNKTDLLLHQKDFYVGELFKAIINDDIFLEIEQYTIEIYWLHLNEKLNLKRYPILGTVSKLKVIL